MQINRAAVRVALCVLFAGAALAQDSHTAEKAALGKPAPAFELPGADGKTVKLSDYADKIVVLEWISHDCPASKAALPTMQKTAARYADKGVVWLAIDSTNYHDAAGNAEYIKAKKIEYPILLDADGAVGRSYGAERTPHMFVINKGKLAYMGAIDDGSFGKAGDRNYVAEAIDALLAGKDVPLAQTKPYGCSVKYKSPK